VSRRWSQPESEYRRWYQHGHMVGTTGDFELGQIQLVTCVEAPLLMVCNMIGQHNIVTRSGVPCIRYESLRGCLSMLGQFVVTTDTNITIHMPRIGCGLAGGEWSIVEEIIRGELCSKGINVFVYDL
jgi:hypothetical protein